MPNFRFSRLGCLIIALVLVASVAIIIDQVTLVRPAWPEARQGDPIPNRPEPGDPVFNREPLAPTFEERRQMFLRFLSAQPTSEERGGLWTELGKLAAGAGSIDPRPLQAAIDFVNERNDTADFYMAGLVRLYYQYAGTGVPTPDQEAAIRDCMVNFKYWLDEPNPSPMELWTENHQILAYSSEYLAGQRFPQETFSNNGQSGSWHMQASRERLESWIDFRARTGMAEWDSIPYITKDIAALLNLVDFAEEERIANQAAMMVDLLLFDIAVDNYYGQYATSHGRIAAGHVKSAAGDSLQTLQALMWGLGRFQSAGEMASISIAGSPRYRMPAVIEAAAQYYPEEYSNYERHSIPLTDEAATRYGFSFDEIEDFPVWWGMGAFTNPPTIALTVQTANELNLWHYPDFRDLADVGKLLGQLGLLPAASRLLDPDPNGTLMSQVDKVTYRTPDYALSNAQDYRKGEKGYQQHIWQATLDPYAIVFVTNPDSTREDDSHRPSYWAANGRMPRNAQYKNLLISLYNIDRHPSPSIFESRHYAFTHAYFPRWAFDQVVEADAESGGGWIFGRKGDGYVALYSHRPYQWQNEGPDADQEIIALGRRNVWICQLGRAETDGSFEDFVIAVSSTDLRVIGLDVTYQAPGIGEVIFSWDEPLTVDGQEISLYDYPRWENPFTTAEFGSCVYEFRFDGKSLILDFKQMNRLIQD